MTLQTSVLTPLSLQISIQVPYDLLLKLATVGVILIATWIASKILGMLLSKTLGKLNVNVAQRIRRMTTWLVWLIGILIGLYQLGLELNVLLVILTIGAVAFVFAFRDILSSFASYEVISIYQPFKIGEWIQVGKYFGRVVDITWMDTVLMTPNNEMVYIPNSEITRSIVVNRTSPGETRISIPLTVPNILDLSKIEESLLQIADELKAELAPNSKPEVRVTRMDNQTVELALLLNVNNPAKSAFIASEVWKKAMKKLEELKSKT